ncbi:MAG: phosphoglucosamine mutase, partial [Deltaproteobacteria bacterium]
IYDVETALGNNGRVLVRYSGTQNLCRVMVEATSMAEATSMCKRIAQTITQYLT